MEHVKRLCTGKTYEVSLLRFTLKESVKERERGREVIWVHCQPGLESQDAIHSRPGHMITEGLRCIPLAGQTIAQRLDSLNHVLASQHDQRYLQIPFFKHGSLRAFPLGH